MKLINIAILFFLWVPFGGICQFETPNDTTSSTPSFNGPEDKSTSILENIVVGGGFDLQFGNYTVIGLTPLVAYTITDDFLAGTIFTYRYFSDNRPTPNYTTTSYGISPFLRYNLFKGIFAHAEYEMLSGEFYYNDERTWVNSLFVGGGYSNSLGQKGFVGIYVLWNLTENPDYIIYNNPVIRMSFGVGIK